MEKNGEILTKRMSWKSPAADKSIILNWIMRRPRWELQRVHSTSIRCIPWELSVLYKPLFDSKNNLLQRSLNRFCYSLFCLFKIALFHQMFWFDWPDLIAIHKRVTEWNKTVSKFFLYFLLCYLLLSFCGSISLVMH